MTKRMNAFRSQLWLASLCQSVSGCWTTPMSSPATTSRRYSGRKGGTASGRAAAAWASTMADNLLLLDAIGEQHLVNAIRQLASAGRFDRIAAVAVELALDLARVRREQQDAIAQQHRLRDRVGHEQHGETGFGPQLQQLLLHLAPRQRVERGERLLPPNHGRLHLPRGAA